MGLWPVPGLNGLREAPVCHTGSGLFVRGGKAMLRIEIEMSREWLNMLEDYCVKAESGQEIPPEDVSAMGDFLNAIGKSLSEAKAGVRRRA
jgi:hypothetical protein